MASYHLSVKTIKRSAGRTATAAGAYRAGERIECQREGRIHDYTRKQGIEETFILTPKDAPSWAQDRSALWNAAEESETRRNSVTAREWELALPSEISDEDRSQITRQFAEELVSRYGVAADVAIHAPHREGDQRNHHAHVLTSTRKLERVDHRSLEAQREAALERGDELTAEELDRDPELKLGPAANAMERREKAMAERQGRDCEPVTERGRAVHAARQACAAFREMRERLDIARETYGAEREAGQGRVSAGLAALRAATAKERGARAGPDDMWERLARITDKDRGGQSDEEPTRGRNYTRERLKEIMEKDAGQDGQAAVHKLDGHSDPELGEGTTARAARLTYLLTAVRPTPMLSPTSRHVRPLARSLRASLIFLIGNLAIGSLPHFKRAKGTRHVIAQHPRTRTQTACPRAPESCPR